ncbi:hypothetical protein M3Y95_00222000 [Aphelenchoides besseyi]|nr:hypothetical protein M3Y95_00222000 [Aphelenchoides besseyi]
MEKLRTAFLDVPCVRCYRSDQWRLRLRQCGHVVCIKCAIQWLKQCIDDRSKARIRCCKTDCVRRIHENDVNALLDSANEELDVWTAIDERERLLLKHEQQIVQYALGDRSTSVCCPKCMLPYQKEWGCHLVQCAVRSCSQWFCFTCGQSIESSSHFGKNGSCKLGMNDLYRIAYLPRMFFNSSIFAVILMLPAVVYSSFVLLPSLMAFLLFCYLMKRTKRRFGGCIKWLMISIVFLPTVILSVVFGLLVVPVGIVVIFAYFLFLSLSCLPTVVTLKMVFKLLPRIGAMFGIESLSDLIGDVNDARILLEIENFQNENSEVVDEALMTASQALEHRVGVEVHNLRFERSLGLDKLRRGAVNVSGAVKQLDENVRAVKKGDWNNVEIIRPSNINISVGKMAKTALTSKIRG